MTPPDWGRISASATLLSLRVVTQTANQIPDQVIAEARRRTESTGLLNVAVVNVSRRPSRRLIAVDTEPLATSGRIDAAQPADPYGLRTLSFASGFRSGEDFAVVSLDRLLAATAAPDEHPDWYRSVWAEIIAPAPQAAAVAAAVIAAVEVESSSLTAQVAAGLLIDRGLTEDEAARAAPDDGGIGEHLGRLGIAPDDLVGIGRSALAPRRDRRRR